MIFMALTVFIIINIGAAMVHLIIDARIKPHHAPVLEKDPEYRKKNRKII